MTRQADIVSICEVCRARVAHCRFRKMMVCEQCLNPPLPKLTIKAYTHQAVDQMDVMAGSTKGVCDVSRLIKQREAERRRKRK